MYDTKKRNHKKINQIYDDAFPYQLAMANFLSQQLLPQYSWIYPKTKAEEKGNKFDCQIVSPTGEHLLKIELEVGKTQYHWKDTMEINKQIRPGTTRLYWGRGLSVPGRKRWQGNTYDVFLKYSTTLKSFFATTPEFIDANSNYRENVSHSYGDGVDNDFFAIPWSKAIVGEELVIDNFDNLKQMIINLINKKQTTSSTLAAAA